MKVTANAVAVIDCAQWCRERFARSEVILSVQAEAGERGRG